MQLRPLARHLLSAALALTAVCTGALAQAYPERAIKIIVPFPPGNASDTMARLVGEQLSKRFGQPVVVDNRTGVSGGLGAQLVAKSAPDGYTLLMTSTSFTINTALTANLLYDYDKDFEPVALITTSGGVLLLAPKDFPANNVAQLIEVLKANPGKYNYAHVGRGTIQHLTMESFLALTGTKVVPVAYKGSVQGLTDMASGQVQLMFDARGSAIPFVQSGRVKMLAITSEQRWANFKDMPTVMESGVPALKNWQVGGWVGLLAPAKTARPIVDRLNKEVVEILRLPDITKTLAQQNMEAMPSFGPERVREFLRSDAARWQAAATAAGLPKE